jgi:hypothetical protein
LLLSVPDQLVLNQSRLVLQWGKLKPGLVQVILALRHLNPSHPSRLAMAKAQELVVVVPRLPAEV